VATCGGVGVINGKFGVELDRTVVGGAVSIVVGGAVIVVVEGVVLGDWFVIRV